VKTSAMEVPLPWERRLSTFQELQSQNARRREGLDLNESHQPAGLFQQNGPFDQPPGPLRPLRPPVTPGSSAVRRGRFSLCPLRPSQPG